jgi:hypothetical protein
MNDALGVRIDGASALFHVLCGVESKYYKYLDFSTHTNSKTTQTPS